MTSFCALGSLLSKGYVNTSPDIETTELITELTK